MVALQDSLPSVLYLQMDNTCRDNKNKYTLTFAALLVQLNIFQKVRTICANQLQWFIDCRLKLDVFLWVTHMRTLINCSHAFHSA